MSEMQGSRYQFVAYDEAVHTLRFIGEPPMPFPHRAEKKPKGYTCWMCDTFVPTGTLHACPR